MIGSAVSVAASADSQLTILTFVAQASFELWKQFGDQARGRAALPIYERLLETRPRDAGALRAAAELSEHFGSMDKSIEYWRILGAGLENGSNEWFEARYRFVRLLVKTDPSRAREVLAQHKAMNPDYGPEPWGSRLRSLDESLAKTSPVPEPSS